MVFLLLTFDFDSKFELCNLYLHGNIDKKVCQPGLVS